MRRKTPLLMFILLVGAGGVLAACNTSPRGTPVGALSGSGSSSGSGSPSGSGSTGGGGVGGVGGAGGAGGQGGAIDSGCDDSGFCDICAQCAVVGACLETQLACDEDGDCRQATLCLQECNASCASETTCYQACRENCELLEPGYDDAVATVACWCNAACPNDCGAFAGTDCLSFAP